MYSTPITITDPSGVTRTDYATGNTKRTAAAAAASIARMEELEGNTVAVGSTRKGW